jgi:hypothetical protein
MNPKGAYYDVYERTKGRLEVSDKMTSSRTTEGRLVQCKWKETKPSHRHGAAMRVVPQA